MAYGAAGAGDGLANSMMDPRVQTLLGLAGGLAQAAMPSRLPVPTGAAIGMGAQGASQGLAQSLQMRKAALENQSLAMKNQLTAGMLPSQLAMFGQMTGAPPGSGPMPSAPGAAPFGVPSPMGGQMAAAAGPGSVPGGGNLMDPRMLLVMGKYALASGQDRAAAGLFQLINTQAGGSGYQVDMQGNVHYTPGGGQDPAQRGAIAGAEANAGVPAALAKQGMGIGPSGIAPLTGFPGATAAIAAASAGGAAGGKAPFEDPVNVQAKGPDGVVRDIQVPRATWAAQTGGGVPGINPAPGAAQPNENAPGNPLLGGIPGKPTFTPEQNAQQTQAPEIEGAVRANAREAANSEMRLAQAQAAMAAATKNGIPPGYFSPELAEAAAGAKSLGIDLTALGIDPKAVGNAQAAREAMVQISGEMLKRLFPQRITNMDVKLYGESLPNYGIDPAALNQVFGLVHQQNQYDLGKASFLENWKTQNGNSSVGWEPKFYQKNGYGPEAIQAIKSVGMTPAGQQAAPAAGPPPVGATASHPDGSKVRWNGSAWEPVNG